MPPLRLLRPALLLALVAGAALAAPAGAQLTTLYSNIQGERTVTGVDSHPVGPTVELGDSRLARAFTPTTSGRAQLLSIRARCVIPGAGGLGCFSMGTVSIHADAGGRPAGPPLGTMGFYLLESADDAWRVQVRGNPTGGTFRLAHMADGQPASLTTPMPFDIPFRDLTWSDYWTEFQGDWWRFINTVPNSDLQLDDLHDRMHFGAGIENVQLTNGRFPADTAMIRLPQGGTLEARNVQLTGGTTPSVNVTKTRVEEQCGRLSPAPQLTAGTKYWAVMTADEDIGWSDWTNDTGEVLESADGGPWRTAFSRKVPALRIDAGADACRPVATANPAPGTALAEMWLPPGGTGWDTIVIGNDGVAPLTLGGVRFEGGNSSAFSVKDSQPGPLAKPYRFGRPMGVGALSILYLHCDGTQEGVYESTMVLETSDPSRPEIAYRVKCVADHTPPRLSFDGVRPDGLEGWSTSLATASVRASDPESDDRVTRTACSRAGETFQSFSTVVPVPATIEGEHTLSCSATDLAGNVGAASTAVKLDSHAPVMTTSISPDANAGGWYDAPVTVRYACEDAAPGSGLAGWSPQEVTASDDTAGEQVDPPVCADVAGWEAEAEPVTLKIDATAPAITTSITPAPNAAGWTREATIVAFACADPGAEASGIAADTVPDVTVPPDTAGTEVTAAGACEDAAGNAAAAPAPQVVKVDATAPASAITGGPSGPTADATPSFAFGGTDALSGVERLECRIDDGDFAPCASPLEPDVLADGGHELAVRAFDAAGNADATPATRGFTVDTAAPGTAISAGPDAVSDSRSALLTFDGDALGGTAVAGFECRLDDAAFAPCDAAGAAYDRLADGEHRFEVRALDAAGNADPTPAAREWRVEGAPPLPPGDEEPPGAGTPGGGPSPGGTPSPPAGGPAPAPQPSISLLRAPSCRSGRATLRLRVAGGDPAALAVDATASRRGVGAVAGGAGAVRTVQLDGLFGVRRARVVVRVAAGDRSAALPIRIRVGTAGDDVLTGRRGTDLLIGRAGDDRISGRGGDDVLCGGRGADRLRGGPGRDTLIGGARLDGLHGGPARDRIRGGVARFRMIAGPV